MHTLESTIVITTILMCIFGCVFMEKEIFARILIQRDLSVQAEETARLMKEPFCEKKSGFLKIGEEGKDIYHPLKAIVNGSTKEITAKLSYENPFKLKFLEGKKLGMFSDSKTEYKVAVKARNFDPVENIRMTDQLIELLLVLKRGN